MVKVVIDAGHGIFTIGKRTPDDEREWSFNNKVAVACIAELANYEGVEILRVDDATGKTDVSLSNRTKKANEYGADLYVSIHHNAYNGSWGNWTGTETYTHPNSSAKSKEVARIVHDKLVAAYGLKDRGLKTANFHVLRETKMPAILVEGGYMDSTIDIHKLRNDNVLKNAGIAIAEGIAVFLKLKKKEVALPVSGENADKVKYLTVLAESLYTYNSANWNDKGIIVKKGEVFTIVDELTVSGSKMYRLKSGLFITGNPKYVSVK